MRRTLSIFFSVLMILAIAAMVAGTILSAKDKVEGQDLYVEYCKSCHMPDSANGEYTPMSLIQDQWETFFSETLVSSHENVLDPSHGNQRILDLLTPDKLKVIKKFAVDHAADSEQPMSCDVRS